MELLQYLAVLRRRLGLILLTVALAVAAAWLVTSRQEIYTAQSTIVVGTDAEVTGERQTDRAIGVDRLVLTLAAIIDSRPFATEALEGSGLPLKPGAVVAATSVTPEPGTQVLRVRVTRPDPTMARALANVLADSFVVRSEEFGLGAGGDVDQAGSALPTFVLERATLPASPLPTGLARNVTVAAMFGLVVAVAVVLLLEYLDVTVRGVGDVETRLALPVLGAIPVAARTLPGDPRPRRSPGREA